MILFKPGRQFFLNNRKVTVDYVIIRKKGLLIQLHEVQEQCRPQDLVPIGTPPAQDGPGTTPRECHAGGKS